MYFLLLSKFRITLYNKAHKMIGYRELLGATKSLNEVDFYPDSSQILDYHYSINPDGSVTLGQTAETAGYALTIPKQAGSPQLLTFSCRLNPSSEPAPVLLEIHPFNVDTEFATQLTPVAVVILPLPSATPAPKSHLVISSPLRPLLSPKDELPVSLFTLQFSRPEIPLNPFLGDQILVYGTRYYEVFIDHCCQNETSRGQKLFPLSPTTDLLIELDGQGPFINLSVYPQRNQLSAHRVRLPLTHEIDWSLVEKTLPHEPHPRDLKAILTQEFGFAVN